GDAVLPPGVPLHDLDRDDEGETHQAGLGGAVVRLAEVAAQAGARDDVDDAAELLLLHHRERVAAAVPAALQVHGDDRVELLLAHVDDRPVADDPGVVHEDVAASPGVEGGLDDVARRREVGDGVVARHRLAAERGDLLAHASRRVRVRAAPAEVTADVVDDDPRALARQGEGDAAADAP